MFCNKCGKYLSGDIAFCPECGNKIVKSTVNTNVAQANTSNINTNVAQTNTRNINTNVNQNNVQPVQNYQQPVQQYQQPQYQQQQYQQQYQQPRYQQQYTYTDPTTYRRQRKGSGGAIVLFIIIAIAGYFFFAGPGADILVDTPEITNGYTGGGDTPTGGGSSGGGTNRRRASDETVIEIDHAYQNVNISSPSAVYSYIKKDSEDQKSACPSEIRSIENKISDEFGITAVNLCEIDVDFARGLYDSIKWVYNFFPSIKGKLTNLTIGNIKETGAIAYYRPVFIFLYEGSTDNPSKMGLKMSVVLGADSYLFPDKFTESMQYNSQVGHFPPNATKYSPLVHELGHYTSFVALMKNKGMSSTLIWEPSNDAMFASLLDDFNVGTFSKKLIEEAYDAYLRDGNPRMEFDEWRSTISGYAMAKDKQGLYIYDETIAESLHDYYLNGNNAKPASKYIVNTLKKHVEG